MSAALPSRRPAVLETSFWVAAYRAEIAANCFDFFDIVVPRAVEAEIRSGQTGAEQREYPYTTLFRQFRDRLLDPPADAPPPLRRFGAGEAEAIPLAAHLKVDLLINERRAAEFAASQGLHVVTAPAFVVFLRELDVISDRAARRKLEVIEAHTAGPIIARARRALDLLRDAPN